MDLLIENKRKQKRGEEKKRKENKEAREREGNKVEEFEEEIRRASWLHLHPTWSRLHPVQDVNNTMCQMGRFCSFRVFDGLCGSCSFGTRLFLLPCSRTRANETCPNSQVSAWTLLQLSQLAQAVLFSKTVSVKEKKKALQLLRLFHNNRRTTFVLTASGGAVTGQLLFLVTCKVPWEATGGRYRKRLAARLADAITANFLPSCHLLWDDKNKSTCLNLSPSTLRWQTTENLHSHFEG